MPTPLFGCSKTLMGSHVLFLVLDQFGSWFWGSQKVRELLEDPSLLHSRF